MEETDRVEEPPRRPQSAAGGSGIRVCVPTLQRSKTLNSLLLGAH
jgi:hypothetical protein